MYVRHMLVKDIYFIDFGEANSVKFGIMNKETKKKFKFAAKSPSTRTLWKQTIEIQIEKHCPTSKTIDEEEPSLVLGSPGGAFSPGSWTQDFSDGSMYSFGSEDDRSVNNSPPSAGAMKSDDDVSCDDSTDESRSDGDDSESECRIIEQTDGITIFSHSNLHTILCYLVFSDFASDPVLVKTFLHSYPTLAKPIQVFDTLTQIYTLELPIPDLIETRYSLCDTRKRVHTFVRIWVEVLFDRDFNNDPAMFTRLLDFFNLLQEQGLHNEANAVKLVIIRVNKKRLMDRGLRFDSMMPTNTHTSPTPKLSSRSRSAERQHSPSILSMTPSITEAKPLDFNLTTVAEQLALIEFALFKSVDMRELSNLSWKSDQPRKTAPNVVNIFSRFDSVSQWVATEVVMAQSQRARVATIDKFIQLAQKCLDLRNYNSLMEIIAGLNRGSVQRLKKTWEQVSHTSKDNFRALNTVVDSVQNYKNYREHLRKASTPCLPYFGIFLRDLTFTDVGNPGKIGEDINFEKIYMTSRILRDVQHYQKIPYGIEEDEILLSLLRRLLAMPEEMLYKHSQTIEPSINNNNALTNSYS